MTDTRAMPMTREYLMRYAIRKAVTIPPQKMPSHIYGCPPWLVSHEKKPPPKKGTEREKKREKRESHWSETSNLGTGHLTGCTHSLFIEKFRGASSQGKWRRWATAGDDSDADRVGQSNFCQEKSNANTSSDLQCRGD